MPGTAIVTINENEWQVSIASTFSELTTGLRGVSALAAGTGMLFILPAVQAVSVDTTGMNFALDIIFIANNIVIDVARNIQPGYLVTEETPCDSFLEVNAGEAVLVEAGDTVSTTTIQEAGFDLSSIMSFAIPLALLGFVCATAGGMMKGITGSSRSGEVRRLGKPRTEEERARAHEEFYGTEEPPLRGTGLIERGESTEGRRLGEPKTEAERLEAHLRRYGAEELPERGKGLEEHHSMWLTLEQRKDLEKKYGMVAVRWAEEATKPGDIKAAERAAEYYYGKVKEALGLGHLSPQLTEEQIRKLREVLGLTASMAEVLRIHQETGYIP